MAKENRMLKGAQKRMIVIRTRDSRLFEEAYFVMRRDLPDTDAHQSDMLWEANRLIERSMGVPSPVSVEGGTEAMRRGRIRSLLFFLGGILTGGGATYLLLLWV
jgi:hypothetical protein